MLGQLWVGAGAVARVGAQSQSSAWCVRLKQYLQRRAFACPVNAMFQAWGRSWPTLCQALQRPSAGIDGRSPAKSHCRTPGMPRQ